jgi:hypothetical protein
LTQRPRDRPEGPDNDRQKEISRTILIPDRLYPDIRCEVQLTSIGGTGEISSTSLLVDKIREAQAKDPFCQETIEKLNKDTRISDKILLAHYDIYQGLLRYQQRVWIPEDIHTDMIKEVHAQPIVGHTGITKTLAILKRQYYWPRMDKTITRYIINCHEYRRAKPFNDSYNGILILLLIPQQSWQDISMDFVTGLLINHRYNTVLVTSCRISKERYMIACIASEKGTSAEATAELVIQNIVKLYRLPDTIVSDRGP